MAPHVVLREAGYTFDLEKVDIPNKKTAGGEDYWKINPKGYVPALKLDDGEVLTEVQVICQYLADHKADSGLAPKAGTMERYRLMEMLNFTASEVHKQIGALFNPKMTPEMKEVQLAYIEHLLQGVQPPLDVGELHLLHLRGHLGVEQRADLLVDLARGEVEHLHEAVALHRARLGREPGVRLVVGEVLADHLDFGENLPVVELERGDVALRVDLPVVLSGRGLL